MMKKVLNISEVADYFGVPVQTIRSLRQEGRFACAFKVGRRLAWCVDDLDEWILNQKEQELVKL